MDGMHPFVRAVLMYFGVMAIVLILLRLFKDL